MDVDVLVRKGDHVVCSIKRPLRDLAGLPAVTYRGKLWPLDNGEINILPVADPDTATVSSLASAVAAADAADASDDTEQERIILAPADARILVPAGPGSGKTEVTARRIAHLMGAGMSPAKILVLSFSRSAVRTLTRRLAAISETGESIENLRHVAIRTFDSWAFRLLRLSGEQPGRLLSRAHEANIEAVAELLAGPRRAEVKELLGDRRHVFIDEFQDLTGCRAVLARELLDLVAPPDSPSCGFTLLGDPAQAIYGFATADSEAASGMDVWDEIRARYGSGVETVALRRNHRSSESITAFSKGLRTVLESGLPAEEKLAKVRKAIHGLPSHDGDIGPEWAKRPYATSAILARTNGDAVRIMQRLMGKEAGAAPAKVILKAGSCTPPPPAWIASLLAPLKSASLPKGQFDRIYTKVAGTLDEAASSALSLPSHEDAWLRLLHAAGQAGEDSSLDLAQLRTRLSWPDAFPDDEQLPEDGLYVTTVHQSKGMEFDEVHLLEPRADRQQADSPLEEASVGFVGVTRAGLKVGRIPCDAIYSSLTRRKFYKGGDRLYSWRSGWVNLEMGLPGDIAAASFVDEAVHGSREAVDEVQQTLLDGAGTLAGQKVLLCKVPGEGSKVVYDIHLLEADGETGLRIGRTGNQLTTALLDLLWKKGYSLPSRIMNLRLGSLGTFTAGEEVDANIPEPWSISRLWLGCSLVGTGDFKSFKRTGGKK